MLFASGDEAGFALLGPLLFALVGYIVSSFGDPVFGYLRTAVSCNQRKYIEKLQSAPPKLSMHIRCYHSESYTDSKGNRRSRDVVTHRAEEPIPYRLWDDVSKAVLPPESTTSMLRLTVSHSTYVADAATQSTVDAQYSCFVERNTSDAHQRHSVVTEVEGLPPSGHVLLMNEGESGGCFGTGSYVLFTLLTLSAPYRMIFYASTARAEVELKKVVVV